MAVNTDKPILDACCGSRMMWFDKTNADVVFGDIRSESHQLKDRGNLRSLEIKPDVLMDFTDMPLADNTFKLVVLDPPHLKRAGPQSWMAKKYGKLTDNWPLMINQGVAEAMRVLQPGGTLIFKWNETQVKLSEVLNAIEKKPLFWHTTGRQSKTIWLTFLKPL